jgi:hypothetical protein
MARAAGPLVPPQQNGGALRGFADRIHFAATRRNGATARGTGYDNSVLFGAMCERDHRFDDPVA